MADEKKPDKQAKAPKAQQQGGKPADRPFDCELED